MVPTLSGMMFSVMHNHAFHYRDTGFPIRYRIDGKFFNLKRLQTKTKVQTDVLDVFFCANDMDTNTRSESMDQVS